MRLFCMETTSKLFFSTNSRQKHQGIFAPKGAMNQIDTQKEKNGGAISFETKIEQQLNLSVSASA